MIKKEITQWLNSMNWSYDDFNEILQQIGISKPYHLKRLDENIYTGINDNGRFKIQLMYINDDKIGNIIAVTQRNKKLTYNVPFKKYNSERIKIYLMTSLLISDYKILDSKYDNDFCLSKILSLEHNDKNYLLTFKLSSKVKIFNKYVNNAIIDDFIFSLEYKDLDLERILKIIINLLYLSEEFLDGCEISFFLETSINHIGNQVIEGFHIKNDIIQEYVFHQYSKIYDIYRNGDWTYIEDSVLQITKIVFKDNKTEIELNPNEDPRVSWLNFTDPDINKISEEIENFKYKLDEKPF